MQMSMLVVGDILMLILFAFLGQSSHKIAVTLGGTLETAAPFIIAWLIIALFAGLYRKQRYQSIAAMFKKTLPVWAIAMPAGLGLRALYLSRGIPLSFFIVTMISTFILLFLWRSVFVWLYNVRRS